MTTSSFDTDVLVVGAGPGGSAAAYHLAKQGVDVALVDKAIFPREKVCGDGLTPRGVRALQHMDIDPAAAGFVRIDALRSHGLDGVVDDYRWPDVRGFPSFGVVRTRFEFDNLLMEHAVKAGALFHQGTEAGGPVIDGRWVTGAALTDQDGRTRTVRARFVVAADGASSRFASRAGVRRDPSKPVAIAARRYYRVDRRPDPVFEAFLNLPDPTSETPGLLAAYGWIFPVGEGLLNVGTGVLNTFTRFREMSARRVMDIFLAQLPPEYGITEENAVGPLLSGPIPMGINRTPVAVPGLLVVGDAAGVTNPFNGEGIAYAMETGELAAELLTDAITRGRPAVAQMYPVMVKQRYGRYFRLGNGWVRMIGKPTFMRFAVDHGFPRRWAMQFALRLMANLWDEDGRDLPDRIIKRLTAMVPAG
ncbi:MAG: geranylgeranyl reductase family protein [Actinomycetota bacterium]